MLELLKPYAELIAILSLLVALVGLRIGYKQITAAKTQNDLALRQFNEKPELSLSFFHADAADDIYIVFTYGLVRKKH